MSIDTYQLNDTFRQDFTVSDPASGAAVDADADPDIEIYENGGTAAMVTGTAAKRDAGTTGQYTFSDLLATADGYEIGKIYTVYAIATVGGVTGKVVIATFRIEAKIVYVG